MNGFIWFCGDSDYWIEGKGKLKLFYLIIFFLLIVFVFGVYFLFGLRWVIFVVFCYEIGLNNCRKFNLD